MELEDCECNLQLQQKWHAYRRGRNVAYQSINQSSCFTSSLCGQKPTNSLVTKIVSEVHCEGAHPFAAL